MVHNVNNNSCFLLFFIIFLALGSGNTAPTFIIPLPYNAYDLDLRKQIIEFTEQYSVKRVKGDGKRGGFVIKSPFTTNSEGLVYQPHWPDVINHLINISSKHFGMYRIPYMILQPCLANAKEVKYVYLNGKQCCVDRTPLTHSSYFLIFLFRLFFTLE